MNIKQRQKPLLMHCGKKTKKKQKIKEMNNKEMEMGKMKQISKQEETQEYCERRQVGGTEKVKKRSNKVPFKERKKIIKHETNEEKSLIGINRGQGIKKQEKREERQFPHQR